MRAQEAGQGARRPGGQELDHPLLYRAALPGCSAGCPLGVPRATQARLSARSLVGRCRRATESLYVAGRGVASRASRSILRWTSPPASFPPRVCQTRNKRGLFIELGLEHNVNVVRSCDASQCSAWPRIAASCCVAFIPSSRPCDHTEDGGAAFPLRSQGRPEWSQVVASSLGARLVASRCRRRVAFASPQSPKPSIGPAMADLRRAAAASKCARLAARLADLAGPGEARLGAACMSVAQYSCRPRTGGAHWVALSEAAAAIVRSLPPPAPRTRQGRQSHQSDEDD